MKSTLDWCPQCRLYVRRLARHNRRKHSGEPTSTLPYPPSSSLTIDDTTHKSPVSFLVEPPAVRQPPIESPVLELTPLGPPLSPWLDDVPDIELMEEGNVPVDNGNDPVVASVAVPSAASDAMVVAHHADDLPAVVRHVDEPPTVATIDAATQADGTHYIPARTKRQLFTHVACLYKAAPYDRPVNRSRLTPSEEAFADAIDFTQQRRLCDCRTCVRRAVRLTSKRIPYEMPLTPGVRMVALPGVGLPSAPTEDKRALAEFLTQHPYQSLVVCGCTSCTLHRNLLKAWTQVRHFSRHPLYDQRMSRP